MMGRTKAAVTAWPEGFELTNQLLDFANKKGIQDPHEEFDKFADYHQAKGSKFANWDAAFRGWCRNAIRYANEKPRIGFTAAAPPGLNVAYRQSRIENELAAQEAAQMTPERRRELGRQFSEMVAKIGSKI